MSRSRKLLCALLALILVGVMGVAWAEDYTYTIRIFSSNQGTFTDGAEMLVYHVAYGTRISFNPDSVILKDPGKYSIKGLREAGKDNDTVRASFVVTRDQDYVVAYSVLGDPVAYTVRFVDRDGQTLAPAKTYYGNVGDRPVIAFLYMMAPRISSTPSAISQIERLSSRK